MRWTANCVHSLCHDRDGLHRQRPAGCFETLGLNKKAVSICLGLATFFTLTIGQSSAQESQSLVNDYFELKETISKNYNLDAGF